MKKESQFQHELIMEIKDRFPGAIVSKMDSGYIQGIPDLLVLYKKHWALLEVKRSKNAPHRPNQDYYVNYCNDLSFSAFVYPENMEEVLDGMEEAFQS